MTEGPVIPAAPRWSDLRKRLISAAVMVAVGSVEVWLGGPSFAILVILIIAGMQWELARLTAPGRPRDAVILAIAGGVSLAFTFVSNAPAAPTVLLLPALAFALTPRRDRRLAATVAAATMIAGYGLVSIREGAGTAALVWLIMVVVVSDVAGYFVGRTLGGAKFWPAISPKKTWSGTVAGWVGAGIVGAGFAGAGLAGHAGLLIIVVSPLVAFAGQMGDIAESWLKRRAGVKDSSNLIPGHGGLLDRFDALTGAVVAVMALGLVAELPLPAPDPFGLSAEVR